VRRLDYDEDIVLFWYYTGRLEHIKRHFRGRTDELANLDSNGVVRKILTERMRPKKPIQDRIDGFMAKFWTDRVLGVHVRYSDLKTSLKKYQHAVDAYLHRHGKTTIFLATDSLEVLEQYKRRYGSVIATEKWYPMDGGTMHQNRSCPDRVANGIEALVDMVLLARCNALVYSGFSTFSQISAILSNAVPADIVDIDRANLVLWFKRLVRRVIA
jgi:hypothetical protein